MKKLTINKAYELAVKKWQYIVDHDGDKNDSVYDAIPILNKLGGGCSYCQMFVNDQPGSKDSCEGCPLNINGVTCIDDLSVFSIWANDSTRETAQDVLDLIIKTKPF